MSNASKAAAKFTWGDSIRVTATAPAEFRPGSYAAVVGVREPDSTVRWYRYTIEYSDGSSVEIAEGDLTPCEPHDGPSA